MLSPKDFFSPKGIFIEGIAGKSKPEDTSSMISIESIGTDRMINRGVEGIPDGEVKLSDVSRSTRPIF
jgi:hypothetical protein